MQRKDEKVAFVSEASKSISIGESKTMEICFRGKKKTSA